MAKCTGNRCPMQYGYKVEECNHTDCPYRTEPISNADCIRAMSDEELAKLLLNACIGSKCGEQPMNEYGSIDCFACRMKWLKQPADMRGEDDG